MQIQLKVLNDSKISSINAKCFLAMVCTDNRSTVFYRNKWIKQQQKSGFLTTIPFLNVKNLTNVVEQNEPFDNMFVVAKRQMASLSVFGQNEQGLLPLNPEMFIGSYCTICITQNSLFTHCLRNYTKKAVTKFVTASFLAWTSQGLNLGPPDYESVALTN